jgi:hypothetical protein
MKFIIADVHKIAYMLDPRYLGDGMSTEEKEVQAFIRELINTYPVFDKYIPHKQK